nr:MAG TPA: hypothetical protein [Caudoviricetes sp.]
MKLKDIIKTKEEINEMGYDIANNIITNVNIQTIAHFGNSTCFEIMCNDVCPMSGYHNTPNLGYILKAFIELFDLSEEDGLRIDEIKNIPCRLIFESIFESKNERIWGSRCIGFGHFMKNKFVFTDDFAKVNE